jgi:hypothetical protein
MNKVIKELVEDAELELTAAEANELAELLIHEMRSVIQAAAKDTPLELCGYLLQLDEAIKDHFMIDK